MNLSPNWIVVLAATGAAVGFHLLFALLLREVPVYRERFAAAVSRQLARAHLYVDPGRLLRLNIGAATVVTLFESSLERASSGNPDRDGDETLPTDSLVIVLSLERSSPAR